MLGKLQGMELKIFSIIAAMEQRILIRPATNYVANLSFCIIKMKITS